MDAKIALAQIGKRNLAAVQARDFVAGADVLRFAFSKLGQRIKFVAEIKLAADDTYTVNVFRFRGMTFSKVSTLDGIMADGLGSAVYGLGAQ